VTLVYEPKFGCDMNIVESANARYLSRLSNSAEGGVVFESLLQAHQFSVLRACSALFRGNWLEADHFSGLRKAVSSIYWYVRLPFFFSISAVERIDKLGSGLRAQAKLMSAFLNQEQDSQLRALDTQLQLLEGWETRLEDLSQELHNFGERLLLVAEESRWSLELDGLIEVANKQDEWRAVPSLGYLAKENPGYDALVLFGDPTRLSPGHARLFFCSGLAPKLICLIPGPIGFSSQSLSEKVFGILEPTLHFPSFSPDKFPYEPVQVDEEPHSDNEYREIEVRLLDRSPSGGIDLEELGSSGNQSCKLLRIAEQEVIPIESDAARVSVLILEDGTGKVSEVQVHGSELKPGMVAFALISQGEQEFLWTAARVEMGARFTEFEGARKLWTMALRGFVSLHGQMEAEKSLRLSGVSTANNLESWLSSDRFLRPRADSDFRALLEALALDSSVIADTMRLTSEFNGNLIKVAKTARKLVCEALSKEHWGYLMDGENLVVSLEELGDATYRVGKILSISEKQYLLPASQVRRVVRG
jgi:hypothetical protein